MSETAIENTSVVPSVKKPTLEELKKQVPTEVLSALETELRKVDAIERTKDLAKLKEENTIALTKAVESKFDDFKKSQEPLKPEEIQQMLSQDYVTFKVKVPWLGEGDTEAEKEFTIRELPQSAEKKFYQTAKKELLNKVSELAALDFKVIDGDVMQQITGLMEIFEPVFDVLADACVISLNPRGKDSRVDRKWVQDNLTSYRILAVVNAQIEVNKLRDFFSQLFRTSNGFTTKNPLDVQP